MIEVLSYSLVVFIVMFIANRGKCDKNREFTFLGFEHTEILRGLAIFFVVIMHIGAYRRSYPVSK